MNPKISAVICTHNQADYLRKSLNSLIRQTLPPEQVEIIVVDNRSTDHTKEVLEEFGRFKHLHTVYEPVIGLSQARNTGWQRARGEYVAYLDDDAIADRRWLELILDRYKTLSPKPGGVGGRIIPIWEAARPRWLTKKMETYVGIINWTDKLIFLGSDNFYLAGSNVSYPRALLETSGGFNTALGRKGNTLLSNEEILMQHELKAYNQPICYDPEIFVHHHVKARCLTEQWFYDRFFWQGVSDAILEHQITKKNKHIRRVPDRIMRGLFWLIIYHAKYLQTLYAGPGQRVFARCQLRYWKGRLFTDSRLLFKIL